MRGRTVNNIKFLFLEHLRNLEHKFHDRLADHSVIRTWRFIKLTHLLNWRHIRRFKMLGHSPWLFNSYSLSPSFLGWFRFLLCIYMLVCELSLCHLSRKVTNRDRGANPGLHWLCFVIGVENSRLYLNPPCKTNAKRDLVTRVFPRSWKSACSFFTYL